MCSKVSEENYSSLAPMGPYSTDSLPTSFSTNNTGALLSANLQNVFQNESEIKKYFETKTNCSSIEEMLLDSANIVSEERLFNVLNKIAETKEGCDILKALKFAIDNNPNEKVALVENDEYSKFIYEKMLLQILSQEESIKNESINAESKNEKINKLKSVKEVKKLYAKVKQCKEEEKIEENCYAFDSAKAIEYKDKKMPLIININKNLISDERYIFDKNKITTHNFPANEKSEAYFIAHELTHVISFLNSGVTSEADWKLRKGGLTGGENDLQKIQQDAGWVNFFNETEQMKEVYHGLLLDGFTPKQIIDTFRTFFLNTEEARNVLGLVKVNIDGQETFIGEGEMFKERNRFDGVIVTYLNEPRQLNVIEKAILNKIIDIFQLGVSYINNCPQFLDANDALGDQFEGFNLVNVPRENSAIAATLNANGESLDRVDEISNNISNFLQIHNLDFETSYCMNHDALRDINSIAYNINKSIVVVQSDDKNPQTYTFKKFDTNGQVTTPKSFEEIKEKNPNAVFIYYNGVNHFQAMVPQQPAQ